MSKTPYYITTAIAYTSGKPHIGNTYEIVLADSIARFKRLAGYDVFFMTGTDEHGQKIEEKAAACGEPLKIRAKEQGVRPEKIFVDDVNAEIRRIWDLMNTSYDKFIRTTDADHEAMVQKIFTKLYEQGDIYKGVYQGMYCTPCESFWTESQLVNGRCPDCGREVKPASEEAYFLKLSHYTDRLIEHIETHPDFIQPVSRKNEIMNNFLKKGLQDLCVSRTSFTWGIPVTFDTKHVIYVWIDALCNYITGIGFDVDGNHGDRYKKYWPADVHLIGKDILRFHTIYWPIILMALGQPLPKQIFGHPWLLQDNNKMSKSRGNVIYADDLVDFFGVDAVRYFVLHEMPFESDGNVTWELVAERANSELANTLGNLVNRTISMTNKYFDGVVAPGSAEPLDEELSSFILGQVKKVSDAMDTLHVADAITELFAIFKRCNKYIDETAPWLLAKDPEKKDRLSAVLYNLTEGIIIGASLLSPFMPETADKIAAQLCTSLRELSELSEFGRLESGHVVTKTPEILFARLDIEEVMKKVIAMQDAASEKIAPSEAEEKKEEAPEIEVTVKDEITYDDFAKCQFVVGEILSCEAVPKSKKLLCSQVKVGNQVKQILSGIRKTYSPEEMVGKKVMVLLNLKPAVIAGLTSEGMLLCAEDAEGHLSLMTPDASMPSGSEIC